MTDLRILLTGTKEGQTKMVRNAEGKVELYSWDGGAAEWKKIGDVVGGTGGTNATSGKTLYEGKVGVEILCAVVCSFFKVFRPKKILFVPLQATYLLILRGGK